MARFGCFRSAVACRLSQTLERTMSSPLCPNCSEGMSSVEHGLGGVWSCLYCEGTWLSASQLQLLASKSNAPSSGSPSGFSSAICAFQPEEPLCCPGCHKVRLEAVALGSAQAHYCIQCGGAFFKKGVVAACAPEVFSSSQEAPVVLALLGAFSAATLLSDPLLLIAALATRPRA